MVIAAKGAARVLAITDGTAASGLPPGAVGRLGGRRIVGDGRIVRLEDGTLAGSALTMDGALRTIVGAFGCELTEAVQMCATTPARALGLDGDDAGQARERVPHVGGPRLDEVHRHVLSLDDPELRGDQPLDGVGEDEADHEHRDGEADAEDALPKQGARRMPIFDYKCRTCGHTFEALVRGNAQPACTASGCTACWRPCRPITSAWRACCTSSGP